MDKNLNKFSYPKSLIYLIFLAAFALTSVFFKLYELAVAEGTVTVILAAYTAVALVKKRKALKTYIEQVKYETDNAKSNTLMNFPLPIAVFRIDDTRIIWANTKFFKMCGTTETRLDSNMKDYIPDFNGRWLLEGKEIYGSLIEIMGHKYQIHGNVIRSATDEADEAFMGISYWVDVTELDNMRTLYANTRPVAGIIVIDNYDELNKNIPDREKNDVRDEIEDRLTQWGSENASFVRRYERDRYIAFFEKQYLELMRENKFSIVESVHSVENQLGISASISIGLGEDCGNFGEALQAATNAVELALSRGGDQAVIKTGHGYEFFGGRGNEVEKRTKVRSRVMANAFAELVRDSSKVFVMGHKYADLDTVGAAAGICALSRKLGVETEIIINRDNNVSRTLIEKLEANDEYSDGFISVQEAMLKSDGGTLLVIVDTSRPEQVEDRDILESCRRVVVIDHHRVAATYIDNAAMNYVEPYASSASELVTEMLEEILDKHDLLRCEAEALLAGMVLDTKNFTVRTGERTFEAAAYLRRVGADTSDVKKLLQSDMSTTVAKYNVLTSAKLYRGIALAAPTVPQTRIVAAQAADELLNVSGVEASVVMAPDGKGGSFVSARSIGEVNVQILMEKLGGGGNRSVAAAQFEKTDIGTLYDMVKRAIDDYYAK